MGRVMLATNAGADSRILHVAALRRAEERDADLTVVHVIAGTDYEAQPDEMNAAIRSETGWLIHTMLGLAAERSGVASREVTILVREGDVADVLVDLARSTRPDVVMVGVPRADDRSEFTTDTFAELLARLEDASVTTEQIETG